MITIKDITIENYRSIIGTPLQFTLCKYNVIVGPNNAGKSNILRAFQLFFNGHVDSLPYDASVDFPKATNLHNAQTRITVTMQFDPSKDNKIDRAIKVLETESSQKRLSNNLLRLRLEYTRQGKPQWRFISKAGLRSIRAGLIEDVVEAVRSSIKFKYLPVGRDIQETISRELSDELIRTVFSGWRGAVKQTSTLLFLLKYLAEHHPQRHNLRVTYVWAIEEPESYLHPSRQRAMSLVLQKFSEEVQTMITTHSAHFIPRSKGVLVAIVDKNTDEPHSTFIRSEERR